MTWELRMKIFFYRKDAKIAKGRRGRDDEVGLEMSE
jgi:hypothetical protein